MLAIITRDILLIKQVNCSKFKIKKRVTFRRGKEFFSHRQAR